jgi:carbon-monoxide dehydrogenase medium subunit
LIERKFQTMYAFNYQRPDSLQEAAALIHSGGQALAGGQTLLASMKLRLSSPESLVDLSQIPELKEIKLDGHHLVIGAMVKHAQVASNPLVKQHLPAVADLAAHIGDKQVRAMGTIGGSVANNDPSACYPSAVLALGANIHTTSRVIAAQDFFLGMFSTALEPGELITAISFPCPKKAVYLKFKQQASRFALVGVFMAQMPDGVRVAITGASQQGVFRHAGLEAALSKSFTVESAASVRIEETDLNHDIHASAAYRAHMISVQAQRAVKHLLG